ncbi:MAG: hypothetical protein KF681_12565 [Bdellovibrionaceae bacterium]|nr:hypothetical protein [Pseudobdellovibrionaceae bacterium]
MLPEMAVGYAVGWIPNIALTALHYEWHRRKMRSERTQRVQRNLRHVGSVWIESETTIKEWVEGREERDLLKYRRGVWLLGIAGLVLSWIGFFFQLMIVFSIHVIAKSRAEQLLFESPIATKDLSAEEVLAELKKLKDNSPEAFR